MTKRKSVGLFQNSSLANFKNSYKTTAGQSTTEGGNFLTQFPTSIFFPPLFTTMSESRLAANFEAKLKMKKLKSPMKSGKKTPKTKSKSGRVTKERVKSKLFRKRTLPKLQSGELPQKTSTYKDIRARKSVTFKASQKMVETANKIVATFSPKKDLELLFADVNKIKTEKKYEKLPKQIEDTTRIRRNSSFYGKPQKLPNNSKSKEKTQSKSETKSMTKLESKSKTNLASKSKSNFQNNSKSKLGSKVESETKLRNRTSVSKKKDKDKSYSKKKKKISISKKKTIDKTDKSKRKSNTSKKEDKQ